MPLTLRADIGIAETKRELRGWLLDGYREVKSSKTPRGTGWTGLVTGF